MSERLLSSVRVNDDDTIEARWYEPPPPPPPVSPSLYGVGSIYLIPDYARVRYYLRGASPDVELSQADADVLVRMAQIAERYR